MSQMKLDPIAPRTPVDPVAMGLELLQIQTAPAEPFGSHLQRAKTPVDDRSTRDVGDGSVHDRAATDRAASDRTAEDRAASDHAADDRNRRLESESSSAADNDVRDSVDAGEVESREAATDSDANETASAEEQPDADDGERAESNEAEESTGEEAEAAAEGESDADDGEIGAEQLEADLTSEQTVESTDDGGGNAEEGQAATGDVVAKESNAREATTAETRQDEALKTAGATAESVESGKGPAKEADGGESQEVSVTKDSTATASLDPSGADADSNAARAEQETVSAEELAEEQTVQTDSSARQQQVDAQDAGTDVSAKKARQTEADTQGGGDGREERREKKPAKSAAAKSRVADTAPQQQATDETAAATVELKPATAEPTIAAAPRVDAAEGAPKPVGGSADGPSGGVIRADAARPGKAAAAMRAPAGAESAEGPDQARFVGRVARAFEAMGNRTGPVRLKLSPPELGSLRIEITVRGGTMTAQVEAETSTARNLLLDNLPALRDRLAQQGIKIDQFDVDLSDRSPGGLPDQRPDHADSNDRREGKPTTQATGEETEREEDGRQASDPAARSVEEGQLNIVV